MSNHEKINYVEFPAKDMEATRVFFSKVFNWSFEEYGPDYLAFNDGTIDGGFFRSDNHSSQKEGAALVVFYSNSLDATQSKIEAAGGKISIAIFSFPGGHRFHFTDPSGNEFAVWSDAY